MKKRLLFVAGLCLFTSLWAELTLPSVFSDNLVLQSGAGTPVFGKASPRARVDVVFKSSKGSLRAAATADKNGKWVALLPELAAGLTGTLEVKGDGETKTFKNALVGEVWICSGQSNMEYSVGSRTMPEANKALARKEAAAAKGAIRMFRVRNVGADTPQDDVVKENSAGWEIVTPENVNKASAVAWNFAVRLNDEAKVPVGILDTCWGGSPVEAWIPREVLDKMSVASSVWALHENRLQNWEENMERFKAAEKDFLEKYPTREEQIAHNRERMRAPYSPTHNHVPVRLYNGMIHGLEPYGAAGVLWYQGETNGGVPRCYEYGELICGMLESWRARFGRELPFYYVELANFMKPQNTPVQEGSWAYIREQQGKVLALPKTGVATAIDVGVANDIHPTDKKTVGNRLAGMALNDIYGKKSLCRSPEYKSHAVKDGAVVVSFNYADGLRARDEALEGFAVCGEDGQWVWAESTRLLPDGTIAVASEGVKNPVAVRYGWANNPKTTVENAAGLPLRPFRTDTESEK